MKKIYTKLFLTAMALLLSVTMIVSVTYSWLVISKSPAVNGVSVMIGGGKTILLAADLTTTVTAEDGRQSVVHYPGGFADTLRFSDAESGTFGALSPVSTADGIHWVIPRYDENGTLLETKRFEVDSTLTYANGNSGGGYLYLDFWMVSPGSAYDVRVSMDKQSMEGSYLMELPDVEETADGGYTLSQSQNIVASSARVGFLVSGENAGDAALGAYLVSEGYDDRYTSLLGVYPEGEQTFQGETRFTIYEPNGTLHPNGEEGAYLITRPLGYDVENGIQETDIGGCLAVQRSSAWKTVLTESTAEREEVTSRENTQSILLEQIFQAAIARQGKLSLGTARDSYLAYLREQESAYLSAGAFFKSTAGLYAAADENGSVTAESVQRLEMAGASDGAVIVRLTRNVPQRVRMYLWIEGQDPDCRNDSAVDLTNLVLKIELAGSTP